MNPDEYDEHHVSDGFPPAKIEPLTTHYQEMITINPLLTTSTRSRHIGNKKSNNSNNNTLTRLLLDEQNEL